MKQHARLFIGTSGWAYKHWKGTFYPAGTPAAQQLDYYARFFRTVELNSSFYGLPSPETFRKWAKQVPEDFLFSVKAGRYISHLKKLNVEKAVLQELFSRLDRLKGHLGPVLFQLPPRWNKNTDRLHTFLNLLPKKYRYVFEFRNSSWYNPEVYSLLREYHCAFCIYELAGHLSPLEITAGFVYLRLHGPGKKYEGSYSHETLRHWAERCSLWNGSGKDVYVYFDNDQEGYAAFNALELLKLTRPVPA